jgi:hypothetical protein
MSKTDALAAMLKQYEEYSSSYAKNISSNENDLNNYVTT